MIALVKRRPAMLVVCAIACAIVGCGSFGSAGSGTAADAGPGSDAAPASEGSAGPSFCAAHTTAKICSDFDGADAGTRPWNETIGNGGTLGLSGAVSSSPPRSLESTLHGGTSEIARLTCDVSKTAKRVRLSFAVRRGMSTLSAGQQVSIGEIYCATGSTFDGLWLFAEGPSADVTVYTDLGRTKAGPKPLATNGFTSIVIDAHFDTSPASAVVSIDGQLVNVTMPTACSTYETFQVVVGLSTASGGTAQMNFDDILYELDPSAP